MYHEETKENKVIFIALLLAACVCFAAVIVDSFTHKSKQEQQLQQQMNTPSQVTLIAEGR